MVIAFRGSLSRPADAGAEAHAHAHARAGRPFRWSSLQLFPVKLLVSGSVSLSLTVSDFRLDIHLTVEQARMGLPSDLRHGIGM